MITTVDAWPEGIEQSLAQSLAGVSTIVINAQHFDTGRASVFHVSHGLNKLPVFLRLW